MGEAREVEGSERGEPEKETREERKCLVGDGERSYEVVGDGEELS